MCSDVSVHAEVQIEIKRFLERVYGLNVEAVRTVNYEGKRKRRKQGFFQESDYKKVPCCSQPARLPWHAYAMTAWQTSACHRQLHYPIP